MNAARPHTDGERHDGDTTVIIRAATLVTCESCGVRQRERHMRRCDECNAGLDPAAIDLAADLYVQRNESRMENEWETLPEAIDADDVVRAIGRLRLRRLTVRAAIDANKELLSTPLPKSDKSDETPADQRADRSEVYTGRVPFWLGVVLVICALLMAWGIYDLACRLREVLW